MPIYYSVVDVFLGVLKDFGILSSFERVKFEMKP